MRSARQSAIRLLQLMMVASVVLPLVLFDDDMRSDQLHLHEGVKRIVDALPEVQAIFLINRDGRPLVSSRLTQIPADFDSRERSFFPRRRPAMPAPMSARSSRRG